MTGVIGIDTYSIPNLPRRSNDSWESLVGSRWAAYVRILHPAARETETGTLVPVPWRDIAPAGTDLAAVDWHAASGVHLHTGRTASGWDIEPDVGPGARWVAPALSQHLLESFVGTCWLGYWIGYGRDRPEGAQALSLGEDTYDVVPLTPGLGDRLTAGTSLRSTYPDIMWDEGGTFLMVANVDLPSTILGCATTVAQRVCADPGLETLMIDPLASIVA